VCAEDSTVYLIIPGYSAQAIYHTEIAETMLRNHVQPDDYTTDKPLIYAVLVETYFTLGRALMAEKKYVVFPGSNGHEKKEINNICISVSWKWE